MMSKKRSLSAFLIIFFCLVSLQGKERSYKIVDIDGKEIIVKKIKIDEIKITHESGELYKQMVASITVIDGVCEDTILELIPDFSRPSMRLSFDLVDGSHFEKIDLTFGKKKYLFSIHGNKIVIKNSAIRSFILKPRQISRVADWHKWLKQKGMLKDKLIIDKKGVVVTVEGIFLRFDFNDQKVIFLWDGKERKISIDKVIGIILASKLINKKEYLVLSKLKIVGESVVLNDGSVTLNFLEDQKLKFSIGCINRISLSEVKIEYLSNLKPTEVESASVLIENVEGYKKDKSIWNNSLSIGKKVFKRGVGVHSKSVLKYKIPDNARKFRAYVGIDNEVKNIGGCIFKVLVDGKEEFQCEVTSKDKAVKIDLNVVNKKELTLMVLPGKNLDVGDHGTWGDAKFLLR